jgi:hypothetical protein
MMRHNPTSEVLVAENTEPALLEPLGTAWSQLFNETGQRVGTLGMQHGHASDGRSRSNSRRL